MESPCECGIEPPGFISHNNNNNNNYNNYNCSLGQDLMIKMSRVREDDGREQNSEESTGIQSRGSVVRIVYGGTFKSLSEKLACSDRDPWRRILKLNV